MGEVLGVECRIPTQLHFMFVKKSGSNQIRKKNAQHIMLGKQTDKHDMLLVTYGLDVQLKASE